MNKHRPNSLGRGKPPIANASDSDGDDDNEELVSEETKIEKRAKWHKVVDQRLLDRMKSTNPLYPGRHLLRGGSRGLASPLTLGHHQALQLGNSKNGSENLSVGTDALGSSLSGTTASDGNQPSNATNMADVLSSSWSMSRSPTVNMGKFMPITPAATAAAIAAANLSAETRLSPPVDARTSPRTAILANRKCSQRELPPSTVQEAIERGNPEAFQRLVQGMSKEDLAEAVLENDREKGTPLMQAAAGKCVDSFRAVLGVLSVQLGQDVAMSQLVHKDGRDWTPLMHASWSGAADVFQAVVVALEEGLGRSQVAYQLVATAKYGWTPLHAAARGNADVMPAVMAALVNYLNPEELKSELQSGEKDSILPTPLMFGAASSSLDAQSLTPLLTELLGAVCDIDESRRQRTAVDYAAAYSRLDTLSCLIAHGCVLSEQTVATLLDGEVAVGAAAFNRCIWKGITMAKNPLVPAFNVTRAIGRAAERDHKHRQFLLRMQMDVDNLVLEMLHRLPNAMAGFSESGLDYGQGYNMVLWSLEPERAGKRVPTFAGPLARALETRRLAFFQTSIVLEFVAGKFRKGLPALFSSTGWNMPSMFDPDTKRFVLCLPYGSAPQNLVGVVRMRLFAPLEMLQGSALSQTTLLPGVQFNCVGVAGLPAAFYEVPAVRMAFDVVMYLSMLVLFCSSVRLESPDFMPWHEVVFYIYMLGMTVNELGEARALRKLRGQSELWNVVEGVMLILVIAAFVSRVVALEGSADSRDGAFFLSQLFLAVVCPLLFSRFLFLAQIDKKLGLMVQILFRMLRELVRFGVVIGMVLLGFATALYALFGGDPHEGPADSSDDGSATMTSASDTEGVLGLYARLLNDQEGISQGHLPDISEVYLENYTTYTDATLTLFRAMFGNFNFDEFADVRYGEAGIALMVSFLTIMSIMMLNLLIAFLSSAHSDVQKKAQARHWARVVEHDVLPAPLNLVHMVLWLSVRPWVQKESRKKVRARIGCFLFWVVMGPVGVLGAMAVWVISLPWFVLNHLVQRGSGVDRKGDKLRYLITAPGLCIITLLIGFMTIFMGDGALTGARKEPRTGKSSARKSEKGGDFDLAGLLKKTAKIGVDDLRRQLKNPLRESQVQPRDMTLGTTVEHVKLLRDDLRYSTHQVVKESEARLERRVASLEAKLEEVTQKLLDAIDGVNEDDFSSQGSTVVPNGMV